MNKLQTRKQIRLKDYDYSNNGCYFVTICTKNRIPFLWKTTLAGNLRLLDSDFHHTLSEYGLIVDKAIKDIPVHYPYVTVEEYVIMPDHIHLLLTISQCDDNGILLFVPNCSLSTIVGQLKRIVSMKTGISLWQKSYYEHIIRNENDYQQTCEYIQNNPLKYKDNSMPDMY